MEISKWTAEFIDPALEKEYRNYYLKSHIRQSRVGLGLWAIFLMIFFFTDLVTFGLDTPFFILLGMRIVVSAAIVVFAILIDRFPFLIEQGYWVNLLIVFGWTGFFLLIILSPRDSLPWIIMTMMVMLFFQLVFIPNRVSFVIFPALYAVGGALISTRFTFGTDFISLGVIGMILLFPVVMSLYVVNRFNHDQRNTFAMLLQTKEDKAELEKLIAEREKLEEELRNLASTDPLTGLYNRRRYEEQFEQELKRAMRYGNDLSLLIIDLDHFKQINDTYGHDKGDEVLKEIAQICYQNLRETDILGRLGGDEFLVLLPDAGLSDAVKIAERVRRNIANLEFESETSDDTFHITASIGVAQFNLADQGLKDLISRADYALYRGKSSGRNRVSF